MNLASGAACTNTPNSSSLPTKMWKKLSFSDHSPMELMRLAATSTSSSSSAVPTSPFGIESPNSCPGHFLSGWTCSLTRAQSLPSWKLRRWQPRSGAAAGATGGRPCAAISNSLGQGENSNKGRAGTPDPYLRMRIGIGFLILGPSEKCVTCSTQILPSIYCRQSSCSPACVPHPNASRAGAAAMIPESPKASRVVRDLVPRTG